MTLEIALVLAVAAATLILFLIQWRTVDLVAILCLVTLCILGLVDAEEALLGFSNPATVTVLALFILSEAVARTGALNSVGHKILDYSGGHRTSALVLLMAFVGIASMFINNTAAVALLIPVTLQISRVTGWCASSLLMPLSFASMIGGVCTLIGTSTNLLANSILQESGFDGFGVFSFFREGFIFFIIGLVYIIFFYDKLIPDRRTGSDQSNSFDLENYLTHIRILPESPYIGLNLDDASDELDFEIIDRIYSKDHSSSKIQQSDILFVEADLEALEQLEGTKHIELLPSLDFSEEDNFQENRKIVEAVVSPDSKIVNKTLEKVELFKRYGLKVMALRHLQKIEPNPINKVKLRAGDTLLLAVPGEQIERLRASKTFVLIREPELQSLKPEKVLPTLGILTGVVLLAAFGLLPIYISALLGVCAIVLFNVLSFEEAYEAVNWRIIFLLAGLLALGKAMESTGATELLSNNLLYLLDGLGNHAVVASYFLITIVLTSILSNNAAAVIMVPLAIHSATTLGMDPINLTLVVMFASSLSFLTPIGYQTNMMVYGVGQYQFSDFLKFGGPLVVLMLATALFVLV